MQLTPREQLLQIMHKRYADFGNLTHNTVEGRNRIAQDEAVIGLGATGGQHCAASLSAALLEIHIKGSRIRFPKSLVAKNLAESFGAALKPVGQQQSDPPPGSIVLSTRSCATASWQRHIAVVMGYDNQGNMLTYDFNSDDDNGQTRYIATDVYTRNAATGRFVNDADERIISFVDLNDWVASQIVPKVEMANTANTSHRKQTYTP